MDSSTNNRPAAIQFSPLLKNTAPIPFGSRRQNIVNITWEVKVVIKIAHTEIYMLLEDSRPHREVIGNKSDINCLEIISFDLACFLQILFLLSPFWSMGPFQKNVSNNKDIPLWTNFVLQENLHYLIHLYVILVCHTVFLKSLHHLYKSGIFRKIPKPQGLKIP